MPIPNYWTWTRSTPQKWFSGQIVIELSWWMLELPHLRYDLSNVIKLFFGVLDRNYDVINFILKLLWFQKTYSYPTLLKGSKFQPCLIKKPVKAQKKLKELEIMCSNATYIYISWYSKICWFLVKKYWCQQDSSGVSHSQGITTSSIIIVGYVRHILWKVIFLVLPICEQPQKKAHRQ